jgi:hypothetical protein
MSLKISKHNIYYNKLYEYKRNLPVELIEKFNQYIASKKVALKNNEKKQIRTKLFVKQMFRNENIMTDYRLYYMKLITFDIIINKSFSFKCLKTNQIFRTNRSFHLVFQNEHINIQEGLDDIIVYIFDNIPKPFFVCIGGGGRGSALSNEIYMVYYYKTRHIYSFCETILTSDRSKILLCNRILYYYKNNNVLPSDKICTTYGYMANMGHTYWNELSAFKFLLDFDLLKHIDMFIIGQYDYYNLYDYLQKNNYNVIRENKIENINSILKNNSLIFKYADFFMYEDLKTFVLDNNKLNDDELLSKIQNVKKTYYPIVTFNLRGVYRYLYDQETCFITIINNLLLLFPNMFVIFDGYVKNKNVLLNNYTTQKANANEDIFDKSYYGIVNKIISGINTPNYVSLIGTSLDKQLAWLDISNYGILQTGSGSTNYGWLMNKKSIAVGGNPILNDEVLLYSLHDFYFRENRNFTTYINPKMVNFDSHKHDNSAFYIDWRVIFFHIVRDLIIIEKNNYSISQLENINKYNIYMNFGVDNLDINVLINMNFYEACNILKNTINTKM